MDQEDRYVPQQENNESIQSILQRIQHLDNGKHFAELANLYYKLGKMYNQIDYYEQADNALSTSLQIFQQIINQNSVEVAHARLQLARANYFLHAREKAIQSLKISLSLFETDLKFILLELDAYNLLGACYMAQNDLQQAREYYQEAICKTITYNINKIMLFQPLLNLSIINQQEGNIDDAIKCCLIARKIQNTNKLTEKLIDIYFISRKYEAGLAEILIYADSILRTLGPYSLDYTNFLEKMFKNVLTAMKEVKDKTGRELIEKIMARHYKEQDLLLDYIRNKLGREKKEMNLMEELD